MGAVPWPAIENSFQSHVSYWPHKVRQVFAGLLTNNFRLIILAYPLR
jgi:hypothetical protein